MRSRSDAERLAAADGWPLDVVTVLLYLLLANAVVLLPITDVPTVRALVGIPVIVSVPGYVVLLALFPGDGAHREDDGVGLVASERLLLSLPVSVAVSALVAFALNYTPFGITRVSVMIATTGFSGVVVLVGARRRRSLPPERQFHPPVRSWVGSVRSALVAETRVERAVNVILILGVVSVVVTGGYAFTETDDGETFTEFYLLSENDSSGEVVSPDLPRNFTAGVSRPVIVGVDNNEGQPHQYTVVVLVQTVTATDETTTVDTRQTLATVDTSPLASGEQWRQKYHIKLETPGEDLRVTFLLYRGDPPATPTVNNAYRSLHFSVTVTPAE